MGEKGVSITDKIIGVYLLFGKAHARAAPKVYAYDFNSLVKWKMFTKVAPTSCSNVCIIRARVEWPVDSQQSTERL